MSTSRLTACVLLLCVGERLARLPVEPMYGKVLLARWVPCFCSCWVRVSSTSKPESQLGGQAAQGLLAGLPFSQATCSQLCTPWPSSGTAERWGAHRRRWRWWPWCRPTWCSTCRGELLQHVGRAHQPCIAFSCRRHQWRFTPRILRHTRLLTPSRLLSSLQRQARGSSRGARPVPQPGGRPPHTAVRVPRLQRR